MWVERIMPFPAKERECGLRRRLTTWLRILLRVAAKRRGLPAVAAARLVRQRSGSSGFRGLDHCLHGAEVGAFGKQLVVRRIISEARSRTVGFLPGTCNVTFVIADFSTASAKQ